MTWPRRLSSRTSRGRAPATDDDTGRWSAHFRLDGMLASLQAWRVADSRHHASCVETYGASACRPVGGGWVGSGQGPARGGVARSSATLWQGDAEITVQSYNAAGAERGPVLAQRPRLSLPQMEAIVTSDVWFE